MDTIILRDGSDPSSLVLGIDKDAQKGFMFARINDTVTQFPRVEIDFQAQSLSLFNSSDLGLVVDNNGLTSIHQLAVDGTISANEGAFALDGAGNLNTNGKIILNGTGTQEVVGTGPKSIGIDFETGAFLDRDRGAVLVFDQPDGDFIPTIRSYTHLTVGSQNVTPAIELQPGGSAYFANNLVSVGNDGTFKAPKFQINPDGSMQVGEALNIDQNGIMTNNGGNIYQRSGYNMVFTDGGGPVVLSEAGTLCVLKVDVHGAVYTEPATNV